MATAREAAMTDAIEKAEQPTTLANAELGEVLAMTVDPILPHMTANTLVTIGWSGSDNVSGIQCYDVQARMNDGGWVLWIPQTLATTAQFQAPVDGFYAFEARAVDNMGLVEGFQTQAEATVFVDVIAPFLSTQAWLPLRVANQ